MTEPIGLDVKGSDLHAEGTRVRAGGPVVLVELPGGGAGVGGGAGGGAAPPATIRKGDAILAAFAAAGRDPAAHGETAARFDLTRPDKHHMSFGHGVHYCIGAPLTRLEAEIALPMLFDRFPDLTLAVPPAALTIRWSMFSNGHTTIPALRDLPGPGGS